MITPRPIHGLLVEKAVEATTAESGSLLVPEDQTLLVIAQVAGGERRSRAAVVPLSGHPLGFVFASGQPISMPVHSSDGSEYPTLAVPCATANGVLGVLELTRKPGGDPFPPEATPVAMLLGEIAGALLADDELPEAARLPEPDAIAAELQRLRDLDTARYRAVTSALEVMLRGA